VTHLVTSIKRSDWVVTGNFHLGPNLHKR